SGAAQGAHFDHHSVGSVEPAQPPLGESESAAERHTSPATMTLRNEITTSPPDGEYTSSPSTNIVSGSGTPVIFDFWGDDESLTELSSDESATVNPSPKKAKVGYGSKLEIDKPSISGLAPTGVANDSGLNRRSPNKSVTMKPSSRTSKFSYGSESEIDEPTSPPPRPTRGTDSSSFRRNLTTSRPKPKRRKAQPRAATQLPGGSPVTDSTGEQALAQLLPTDVDSLILAALEGDQSNFHDAQPLTGASPSSLVGSLSTGVTRKKPKRKRANSPTAASMDAKVFYPPSETTKPASGKRSSRSGDVPRKFSSRLSTRKHGTQDERLSIYAEIGIEDKGRRTKRARKSHQRSVTATQETQILPTLPAIPPIDATETTPQMIPPASTSSLPLPSTDQSSFATGVLPVEECAHSIEEQPVPVIGVGNTDGLPAPPDREIRSYSGDDTIALNPNPTLGGLVAGPPLSPRVSPATGKADILSSPPAEQPRRRKRKRKDVKNTTSKQTQQQVLQQEVLANVDRLTAEAVPCVSGIESRPQRDKRALPQTVTENQGPIKERAKPRKGGRKAQSAITTSGINTSEVTALAPPDGDWTVQSPAILQLQNHAHNSNQKQTIPCITTEGEDDAGPSKLLNQATTST
ncbi:hypothetical protein FRC01_012539, partial [Tulasnella sp. 417]